ncbi:MAG: N-acetylneuraminate synthase family protein [Anaerolineae bacterium]|nr:N-acetylneuraminate synthase family protein [Anaerolineae bacterium]
MANHPQTFEIIAELHPQHGGDKGTLREMIRQAKINGAHVAKFQLYDAPTLLGSDAWSYLQLTQEDVAQIKQWCDEDDIEFMASVFDATRLNWLEEIGVQRHKIASRTVTTDIPLCKAILATGKETIVSLGSWALPGKPFGDSDQLQYLYCKSRYPAFLSDMGDLPSDFPGAGLAGYSDHTLGIDVCLLTLARGARLVEKHFTLDKTRGKPTEKGHICSMTPDELLQLAQIGGALYRAQRTIRALQGAHA